MSHGSTHRFPAEHHEAELARLMAIPAVAKRVAQRPNVDREYDVPDLAGYSVDGGTVYIDRHFKPKQGLERLKIEGLVQHEHVEKTLIDVLGYTYAAAHEMATTAEHKLVQHLGFNPSIYEAALKPFIKRAETEKIIKPPLDLDCHPYYENPDAQDLKILARLAELGVKDAQHPQVKLDQKTVQYGPGHAPEFCFKCVHFVEPSSCHLVEDPILPRGWCVLWQAKR